MEWVGFLDPFFHVTFRNPTIKQLEITTIKYKANARRGVLKAELSGAYDTPRYLVEMQEGIHEEEIHPPIEIDPSGVKEIDLLLRLKNADPGVTYDIEVEFVTRNPTYRAVLPTFAVTFVDASKFRASGNRPVHTEILNGSASR